MADLVDNEGVQCRKAPVFLLCGGEGRLLYARERDRFFTAPGVWDVRWCQSCGLAWLDPRPLPEEVPKLYASYYTHEPCSDRRRGLRALRRWVRDGVLASCLGYREVAQTLGQRVVGRVLGTLPVVRDPVELGVMTVPAARRGRLLDVGCEAENFWQGCGCWVGKWLDWSRTRKRRISRGGSTESRWRWPQSRGRAWNEGLSTWSR